MMTILQSGLEDFSITRSALEWGIPIPDGGGVIYVWFDALAQLHLSTQLARWRHLSQSIGPLRYT